MLYCYPYYLLIVLFFYCKTDWVYQTKKNLYAIEKLIDKLWHELNNIVYCIMYVDTKYNIECM